MQQNEEAPLPDIYKVLPVEVQSIDDWKSTEDDTEAEAVHNDVTRQVETTQNGKSSGVVLRQKQEKAKAPKQRKSLIDRIFGTKKDKKKDKASRHTVHVEPTVLEDPDDEDPDAEDVEAHVERRFEEEAEDEHKEAGDDAKENEPPYDRDSDVEEGAYATCDFSDEENDNPRSEGKNLTRDEWNKLVSSVEDDMDFPEPPEVPEPDYQEEDHNENEMPNGSPYGSPPKIILPFTGSLEDLPRRLKPASSTEELAEPRKLPNPVIASKLHMDLHREMKHNQKLGIDPLHKKTELKREFERRTDIQKKKEMEEYRRTKRTEMEKRLEEQANKLKQSEGVKTIPAKKPVEEDQSEFLRIRSKIYHNVSS